MPGVVEKDHEAGAPPVDQSPDSKPENQGRGLNPFSGPQRNDPVAQEDPKPLWAAKIKRVCPTVLRKVRRVQAKSRLAKASVLADPMGRRRAKWKLPRPDRPVSSGKPIFQPIFLL